MLSEKINCDIRLLQFHFFFYCTCYVISISLWIFGAFFPLSFLPFTRTYFCLCRFLEISPYRPYPSPHLSFPLCLVIFLLLFSVPYLTLTIMATLSPFGNNLVPRQLFILEGVCLYFLCIYNGRHTNSRSNKVEIIWLVGDDTRRYTNPGDACAASIDAPIPIHSAQVYIAKHITVRYSIAGPGHAFSNQPPGKCS